MGLANLIVANGTALAAAMDLSVQLSGFPQRCLRSDRRSSYEQWGMGLEEALLNESVLGLRTLRSGESREGAARFAAGAGRHGTQD